MRAGRPNPKLVKIHRSYSVDEVAGLFGVHRNTVRNWIKAGLKTVDDQRPTVIHGAVLADYLRVRRGQNKRPCRAGEIYCVRCREPRAPRDKRVEYRALTPSQGNLVGVCAACGSLMFRRVSFAKLGLVLAYLDLIEPDAEGHIGESPQPSVICDFDLKG